MITATGWKKWSAEKLRTYRYNGIAVQAQADTSPFQDPVPTIQNTKRRSISFDPSLLPTYTVGKRIGPLLTQAIDADTRDVVLTAHKNNNI